MRLFCGINTGKLKNLEGLNLSNNKLGSIPESIFRIGGMEITTIEDAEANGEGLCVEGNPGLISPPPEVLSSCDSVLEWFAAQKQARRLSPLPLRA